MTKAAQLHGDQRCGDKQRALMLTALHEAEYNPEAALEALKAKPPKQSLLEEWSAADKETFNKGARKFAKEPNLIKRLVQTPFFSFPFCSFIIELTNVPAHPSSVPEKIDA